MATSEQEYPCGSSLEEPRKPYSSAVYDTVASREVNLRAAVAGDRSAVQVVDFGERYLSPSGKGTTKVRGTPNCVFFQTLNCHKCLQYRDHMMVSDSSDHGIRVWDIQCSACLRMSIGRELLVGSFRFDTKRTVFIKARELVAAALEQGPSAGMLGQRTLVEDNDLSFRPGLS
ncbi:hypothetical protein HPB48_024303 [Haemaphysalis longicornis]|uniref:Uncharacterized protein n=1 Tax=Haemaphysalis longicornis TaxID=44386 RepID=A0A9J6H8H5_HAELO|nr:hypothetical protein HPB48_024303 [Haemaphysalis longicornis]